MHYYSPVSMNISYFPEHITGKKQPVICDSCADYKALNFSWSLTIAKVSRWQ